MKIILLTSVLFMSLYADIRVVIVGEHDKLKMDHIEVELPAGYTKVSYERYITDKTNCKNFKVVGIVGGYHQREKIMIDCADEKL